MSCDQYTKKIRTREGTIVVVKDSRDITTDFNYFSYSSLFQYFFIDLLSSVL